ncbi:MAG: hypothetical protein JWN80_1040 [Microbacteriaceae bacterium]|jgi:hypothetical protein|nr:hypothetical protein [Microbacteriaceae bacterium]
MRTSVSSVPLIMPVLGRGRHRSPKSGACFMEFASYLAGERWSDHPACTHPMLADLARLVNDCSSDAARGDLVVLVPSVVGLLGDGRDTTLRVAIDALEAALPVVSAGRQRALAAGALRCRSLVADAELVSRIDRSLTMVPDARDWATRFLLDAGPINERLVDRMCDAIVRTAVIGIAEACVPDPDDRLKRLLERSIRAMQPTEQAREPELIAAR